MKMSQMKFSKFDDMKMKSVTNFVQFLVQYFDISRILNLTFNSSDYILFLTAYALLGNGNFLILWTLSYHNFYTIDIAKLTLIKFFSAIICFIHCVLQRRQYSLFIYYYYFNIEEEQCYIGDHITKFQFLSVLCNLST